MANTVPVVIVANTWKELPTATEFTLTNTLGTDLYVAVSTVAPTTVVGAHILQPGLSMKALTSGAHWVMGGYSGTLPFTEDDR